MLTGVFYSYEYVDNVVSFMRRISIRNQSGKLLQDCLLIDISEQKNQSLGDVKKGDVIEFYPEYKAIKILGNENEGYQNQYIFPGIITPESYGNI
jgi:hypothetical protein